MFEKKRFVFICNVIGVYICERYYNVFLKFLYFMILIWKNDCDNCFKIKNLKGGIFYVNKGIS